MTRLVDRIWEVRRKAEDGPSGTIKDFAMSGIHSWKQVA